ncbi:MAG: hypothetical protein LBS55_01960 [Prevotellaceae bacterium]|jgi:hypothetical protein|nr:hypothetical protein [Prevotellaceae bacterium]
MNLRIIKHIAVTLSGCAILVCCNDSGNNFAVKNIEDITRIELCDRDNDIVLSKVEKNEWLVASFKANMRNVENLKTILSEIEVQYPIPKTQASKYPKKKIIDEGIRIKAFEGKKIVKDYCLLITKDEKTQIIGLINGKQTPYVLTLPGKDIDFNEYLVLVSAFWENNILFSYNAGQIRLLKIENKISPDNSFSVKISDSIALFDMTGKNIPFDKSRMDAYLSYFNNISFDSNMDIPDDEKKKISATDPLYIMTVESNKDTVTCYINPIPDNNYDDYGRPIVYNRDYFYLIVPQKNLFAKAKWIEFDILLELKNFVYFCL